MRINDWSSDVCSSDLHERLIVELTASRTLALRNAVADNPHIAMTALLHKLVSDRFMTRMYNGALEASVRDIYFPVQDTDLKDSPSARAVQDRHDAWAADVPDRKSTRLNSSH